MIEVIKKGIVYKNETQFGFAAWPTVTRLENGALACVFSGDRVFHVCPFGKTMISYSYDEGNTWTPPAAVVNTPFDDRDGGIVAKGKQVLVTSFNNNYAMQLDSAERNAAHQKKAPNHKYYYENLIKDYIALNENANEDEVCSSISVSEDGGYVFNKRYSVPITTPHGPILLKDGRYFYVGRPFITADQYKTPNREYNELPEGIYYMFSNDGYTWTEPKIIVAKEDNEEWSFFCEPHAVELSNGEILVQIRAQGNINESGRMRTYQTVSSEKITKWEKPYMLDVIGSPPCLTRHSSGKIISVFGCREQPWSQQVIISADEGKTWSKPMILNDTSIEGWDLGYPSSVELLDGSILTVYYQHEEGDRKNNIRYTIWRLPQD